MLRLKFDTDGFAFVEDMNRFIVRNFDYKRFIFCHNDFGLRGIAHTVVDRHVGAVIGIRRLNVRRRRIRAVRFVYKRLVDRNGFVFVYEIVAVIEIEIFIDIERFGMNRKDDIRRNIEHGELRVVNRGIVVNGRFVSVVNDIAVRIIETEFRIFTEGIQSRPRIPNQSFPVVGGKTAHDIKIVFFKQPFRALAVIADGSVVIHQIVAVVVDSAVGRIRSRILKSVRFARAAVVMRRELRIFQFVSRRRDHPVRNVVFRIDDFVQ